jgi:hypothetical protein
VRPTTEPTQSEHWLKSHPFRGFSSHFAYLSDYGELRTPLAGTAAPLIDGVLQSRIALATPSCRGTGWMRVASPPSCIGFWLGVGVVRCSEFPGGPDGTGRTGQRWFAESPRRGGQVATHAQSRLGRRWVQRPVRTSRPATANSREAAFRVQPSAAARSGRARVEVSRSQASSPRTTQTAWTPASDSGRLLRPGRPATLPRQPPLGVLIGPTCGR